MLELLNAIFARFTSSSALQTPFPGGWFRDQAPENATQPYVVSHVVSSKTLHAYGGAYREQTQIRYSAYGIGHDAVGAAMNTLTAQLDDTLLTLATGVNDGITRLGEPVPKLHRHDADGNDVWEWAVEYQYDVLLP